MRARALELRWRQFRQLLPHVLRSMRWNVIAATWIVAAALAGLMTWRGASSDAGGVIRAATIVLCLGCASVFDDAAADVTAPSPTRLLLRRGHRLIAILVPLVALAAATLVFVRIRTGQTVPLETVSLELSTLFALTIGAAAVAQSLVSDDRAGTAAAPVVLALIGLSGGLPLRWEFLTVLEGVDGPASRRRVLTALTVGCLTALVASRDPGGSMVNRTAQRMRQRGVGFARGEGVRDELRGS